MLGCDAMKILNIMDRNTFKLLGAVDVFASCKIKRKLNGIGALSLVIEKRVNNAEQLQEGRIVFFNNEYHKAFIIEEIEEIIDEKNKIMLNITAASIHSLIADYITIPPNGQSYDEITGRRETVVKSWIDNNVIHPTNSNRIQYDFVNGSDKSLGSVITEKTRFKNLADEVIRILGTELLGWNVSLDSKNKRYIFDVFEGKDLASKVKFGTKLGNIKNLKHKKSILGSKNVAFTAGDGEGAARIIYEVDDKKEGQRRREVFVDARDAATSSELEERGKQALKDMTPTQNVQFGVLEYSQYEYEKDFDLGDCVSIKISDTETITRQIIEVEEVYEPSKIKVTPIFGETIKTFTSKVNAVENRVENIETKDKSVVNDQAPQEDTTYSSNKIENDFVKYDGNVVLARKHDDNNEGGQLTLEGTANFPSTANIDKYQDMIRLWISSSKILQIPKEGDLTFAGQKVWHAGNDGSGSGLDADQVDGVHAQNLAKNYTHQSAATLNNNTTLESGFYTTSDGAGMGLAAGWWHIINMRHSDNNGYAAQIAVDLSSSVDGYKGMYVRFAQGTTWTGWYKIWHAGNDGAGSGLDSDKVDGKNASGTLLTNNKTDLVGAINELFQSVSNGKSSLETAVTDMYGTVSKQGSVATFQELNNGVRSIPALQHATGTWSGSSGVTLNVTTGWRPKYVMITSTRGFWVLTDTQFICQVANTTSGGTTYTDHSYNQLYAKYNASTGEVTNNNGMNNTGFVVTLGNAPTSYTYTWEAYGWQ